MIDLISRQAVIDLLKQMRKDGDMVPWEGKDVFARIRKLPTIQPEKTQLSQEGTTKDTTFDTISRQAAIDAADRADYTGLAVEDVKKVTDEVIKELKQLPSAQPEIIRCRECKEWEMYGNGCQGWCGKLGLISYDDDYCGWEERREVDE